MYLAYRGYFTERQRHEKLEFLYEAVRTLAQAPDVTAHSRVASTCPRDVPGRDRRTHTVLVSRSEPAQDREPIAGRGAPKVPLTFRSGGSARLVEAGSPGALGVSVRWAAVSMTTPRSRGPTCHRRPCFPAMGGSSASCCSSTASAWSGASMRRTSRCCGLWRGIPASRSSSTARAGNWQLRELQNQLDRQASTDSLTGWQTERLRGGARERLDSETAHGDAVHRHGRLQAGQRKVGPAGATSVDRVGTAGQPSARSRQTWSHGSAATSLRCSSGASTMLRRPGSQRRNGYVGRSPRPWRRGKAGARPGEYRYRHGATGYDDGETLDPQRRHRDVPGQAVG